MEPTVIETIEIGIRFSGELKGELTAKICDRIKELVDGEFSDALEKCGGGFFLCCPDPKS